MKQLTNSAAFLFATIFICTNVGCKKENDDTNETKTELLTSGKWWIIADTETLSDDYDGNGTVDTADIYRHYDACDKDDYFVFNTNGTLVQNEGTTKCNPNNPQTYSTTWTFEDDEAKIKIDDDLYAIEELTNARFRISAEDNYAVQTLTFGR